MAFRRHVRSRMRARGKGRGRKRGKTIRSYGLPRGGVRL